jgi:hypothetical protein
MGSKKNPLGKVEHTSRGFEIIKFKDYNGEESTLQQSSLALYNRPGSSAVWLGIGEDRMHLDTKIAKKLITVLSRWVDTGSFEEPKDV